LQTSEELTVRFFVDVAPPTVECHIDESAVEFTPTDGNIYPAVNQIVCNYQDESHILPPYFEIDNSPHPSSSIRTNTTVNRIIIDFEQWLPTGPHSILLSVSDAKGNNAVFQATIHVSGDELKLSMESPQTPINAGEHWLTLFIRGGHTESLEFHSVKLNNDELIGSAVIGGRTLQKQLLLPPAVHTLTVEFGDRYNSGIQHFELIVTCPEDQFWLAHNGECQEDVIVDCDGPYLLKDSIPADIESNGSFELYFDGIVNPNSVIVWFNSVKQTVSEGEEETSISVKLNEVNSGEALVNIQIIDQEGDTCSYIFNITVEIDSETVEDRDLTTKQAFALGVCGTIIVLLVVFGLRRWLKMEY
jgi:hypothetical protein